MAKTMEILDEISEQPEEVIDGLQLENIVYLVADVDKLPYQINGILLDFNGVSYRIDKTDKFYFSQELTTEIEKPVKTEGFNGK